MRKITLAAAMTAAIAMTAPAQAADEGRFEVKVLGTAVLANGEITNVVSDPLGLTVGAQSEANDNYVPTVAVEYFMTPNVSVETICCLTQHHVTGTGTLAGAELADHVLILPATVTVKYHLDTGTGIRPYVGVGPSVFFYLNEKPGADAAALGVTSLHMDNEIGVALQAGIDIPVSDSGLGVTLDAKKYFMGTTAHFNVGTAEVLTTEHKLDPWVLSAGLFFRF